MLASLLCITLVILSHGVNPVVPKPVVVHHSDSAVKYSPSICKLDCTRVCRHEWWAMCPQENPVSMRTKGNVTSASFTFKGSSVSWFTGLGPQGGRALVSIDRSQPELIDTHNDILLEDYRIFTKNGLDPNVQHTLSIGYEGSGFTDDRLLETFIDIYHFEYEDAPAGPSDTTTSTTSSISSTSTTTTATSTRSPNDQQSSTSTTSTTSTTNSTSTSDSTSAGTSGQSLGVSDSRPTNAPGDPSNPNSSNANSDDKSGTGGTQNNDQESTAGQNSESQGSTNVAVYIAAALGAILLLVCIFLAVLYYRRRRREADPTQPLYTFSGVAKRPLSMANDTTAPELGAAPTGPGLIAMQLAKAKAAEAGYSNRTLTIPSPSTDQGPFSTSTTLQPMNTPYLHLESSSSLGLSPGQPRITHNLSPLEPLSLDVMSPISPRRSLDRDYDSDGRPDSVGYTDYGSMPMTPPPRYVPGPNRQL